MTSASFSIVVCTYNRAEMLANCLRHLRTIQHPDFEILVVNGPSQDHTQDVLKSFPEVRTLSTAKRNISASRNCGLQRARGDLVAFLDDDSEAPPQWLRELSRCFTDPRVGGVGGRVVRDDGETDFQNGLLNRYGLVRPDLPEPGSHNDPGGEWFNTVQGTNCAFRRSALEGIGGFDESYEYYHDEASVCFSLIQAGWQISHCPRAVIRHLIAAGPHRKNRFDMNWTTVMKSTLYFALRSQARQPPSVLKVTAVVTLSRIKDLTAWLIRGRVGLKLYFHSLGRVVRGVAAGLEAWRRAGGGVATSAARR